MLAKKRDQQLSSSEDNSSFGQGSRIVNVEKIKEYTDKVAKHAKVPLCYVVRAGMVWRQSLQGSVPLVSTLLHWRLLKK